MRRFFFWLACLFGYAPHVEASGIGKQEYLLLEDLLDKLEHAILDSQQIQARKNVRDFLYDRIKIS